MTFFGEGQKASVCRAEPRVTAVLPVGDAPSDVVFAGDRANVTWSNRGAAFVLVAKEGDGYVPPACGATPL